MLTWAAVTAAMAGIAGGAFHLYQVRQRPPANSSYVALGSSFAAGLGLGDRIAGSPIVSQRTINGYPQQLARLLDVSTFTDMSSSGATVRHVLHGGQLGLGPQIDALGPDTQLVTLTAGGNDIAYVGDLTAMAYRHRKGVIGTVVAQFWSGAKPVGQRDFASLENNLITLLREVRLRSPKAKIVVATYPRILPEAGTCASLGITEAEAAAMRLVADRLAAVTRSAVARTDAIIVDIAALSKGHDACSAQPWVNGIAPQQGAPFHPTLAGARATALAIVQAIESVQPRSD